MTFCYFLISHCVAGASSIEFLRRFSKKILIFEGRTQTIFVLTHRPKSIFQAWWLKNKWPNQFVVFTVLLILGVCRCRSSGPISDKARHCGVHIWPNRAPRPGAPDTRTTSFRHGGDTHALTCQLGLQRLIRKMTSRQTGMSQFERVDSKIWPNWCPIFIISKNRKKPVKYKKLSKLVPTYTQHVSLRANGAWLISARLAN